MTMRYAALVLIPILVTSWGAAATAQWPSFRGPSGSGVATAAEPPLAWSVSTSTNVAWRTPIPGLGHSSPIVWGDRIFVTTAVSSAAASRTVALGDSDAAGIDPSADRSPHEWRILAIDRASGRVLWSRTVHQGVPRVRRHVKGSHASATPATDGRRLVALFGSEALVAFDLDGAELWRADLGVLALGLADDPTYEWGPASSPVIHGNLVLVQNDRYKDSFLIAFELDTGREVWRSPRNELPAWATPLVHTGLATPTVVTSSPRFVRGHDLRTGRERWRIADPEGQVKVSTPVAAGDLAIVTGGWPPAGRPILAVRVADGSVAWRHDRGSPYTTTPLVHDGLLYVLTDNGILSVYQVSDGARAYQQRLSRESGSFSASPVAASGRLYFASEDGKVYVIRAGRTFELLAVNDMGEVCMATPAPAGNMLIVRTRDHLYALGSGK
jgi:outer membrane protein assembly factor BamB